MDRNTRCRRTSIDCERVAYQPSALWHCASLHSASKPLSASRGENRCAAFMNAYLVCWPLKANRSIRVYSHKKAKRHIKKRELVQDLFCAFCALFVATNEVRRVFELTE